MNNTQRAVNIVNWSLDHWVAVLIGVSSVVVCAFLVALVTELRKRYLSKKQEEKIEGWVIQKTLASMTLLLAGLDYFVPFLQHNLPTLSNLKYVGPYMVSVYAAANFLYALKFKKWFTSFRSYLENRKTTKDVSTVQPQQPVQPQDLATDSPFEAQV
jgi:hypothetical protein